MNESESEFEIIPSRQPLLPETRMPIPELSYEQELAITPVPFQNRVEALSNYVKPTAYLVTLKEIAEQLEQSTQSTLRMIKEIGAGEIQTAGSASVYELYTLEVLQEEKEWQESYEELLDKLTASAISDYLGRTRRWVIQNTAGLNIYPHRGYYDNYHPRALVYNKEVVLPLRTISLHAPLANEHYCISELQDITKKDHRWIEKVAKQYQIETVPRTHLVSGEIGPHYPKEFLSILEYELQQLPPSAANWLTEEGFVKKTGLTKHQVHQQLAQYREQSETRLRDDSIPARHYPPELEALLIHKENNEPAYTYLDIASLTGRSIHWVREKATPFLEEAFRIPGSDDPRALHFLQHVADAIGEIARQEPPLAEGWLTIEDITRMLPRHRSWVVKRLETLAVKSEVRLDVRMKPRMHYEPDTIDALQLNFLIDEENNESII